jgi:hypothetical protein
MDPVRRHEWLGVRSPDRGLGGEYNHPADNIEAGFAYFALQLRYGHGNLVQALDNFGIGTGYSTSVLRAGARALQPILRPMQAFVHTIGPR